MLDRSLLQGPSSFVLMTSSTSFPTVMTGSKTLCSLAKEILSSLHLSAFSVLARPLNYSVSYCLRVTFSALCYNLRHRGVVHIFP